MLKLLPERLRLSVEAMKLYYPSLLFDGRHIITGGETFWKGWVQPLSDELENLEHILADVDQNRPVQIKNGEVSHHPACRRNHQSLSWIKKLKKPDQAFNIKIVYDGGKRHPRGYVLQPNIPENKGKHMYKDKAVCAYPPQGNVWNWQTHTVADFTNQFIIWLVKWNVWNQTGYWLGDETSHDKLLLLISISATDQCWCGSGALYGDCHLAADELEITQNLPYSGLVSLLVDKLKKKNRNIS